VLFLDEIDALGGTRAKEMHEASRRMLSTLLRHMDGLDAGQHVALIGATNRPRDLDPALISRFDVRVSFPAPDAAGRASIFARYARQLDANALSQLGDRATGLSGRDILNVCKSAERKWVCSRLRAGAPMGPDELPPLEPYQEAVTRYLEGMTVQEAGEQEQRRGSGGTGMMMASEGV
jgi:SpoVK/Ycf46/Vps4 family AAA+-type ATPase